MDVGPTQKRKYESNDSSSQKSAKTDYYSQPSYQNTSNNNNNNNVISKPFIKTVASAAPVRYSAQPPPPVEEEFVPVVPLKADTAPIPKLIAAAAPSYQEALRSMDKNNQPVYVFPHAAPNKGNYEQQGPKKVLRAAAGEVWEDPTLADWDPDDYRIFVGDLGNEVNEEQLARAFGKYPSLQKVKVIRDKRTGKSKGYGFVSFQEGHDFVAAMREMNGKYIGNRPCKLRRSRWQDRAMEDKPQVSNQNNKFKKKK